MKRRRGRAGSTALLATATWLGCGNDSEGVRCDEALGYVCQKGAEGRETGRAGLEGGPAATGHERT